MRAESAPFQVRSSFAFVLQFFVLATVTSCLPTASGQSVIPAQFIAKLYSEALGRAPDQNGWNTYVNYFESNGCGATQLSHIGEVFYESSEFAGDYSDNQAKVIALYRGALNRDPDSGGFNSYVNLLNSGSSWATAVGIIFTSAEFNNDVASLCDSSTPNYHFGSQPPVTPTPGATGFTGTGAQLQSLLNGTASGGVVYLAQKAVVTLSTTLTIPSGVTLETYGTPATYSYALMARLVRGSTFDGPNVELEAGAQLKSVWVDGQRNVLGYFKPGGGAQDNANVVTLGGMNTTVASNKLSDPQGGTNFFSVGGTASAPCGNQAVQNNLVTAYSANHGFTDNADGLTMLCEGLDITGNYIVDVSDIGIVLFAAPGVTQHSTISNNLIVSAGISMNAPISSDPSTGNPGGSSLNYTGTLFTTNLFWTGPYTTFDFAVEAGAREYFATADNSDGTGATYTNNYTGVLSARVRAGIAVAGMLDVSITNDSSHPLQIVQVSLPSGAPAADCPGGSVIVEASTGHASGTYPTPTVNGNFDGCVLD